MQGNVDTPPRSQSSSGGGARMLRTDETFHKLMDDFEKLIGVPTHEFKIPDETPENHFSQSVKTTGTRRAVMRGDVERRPCGSSAPLMCAYAAPPPRLTSGSTPRASDEPEMSGWKDRDRPSTTGTLASEGLTHFEGSDGCSVGNVPSPQAASNQSERPSSVASFRSSIESARHAHVTQVWNENRECAQREREELELALRQRAVERSKWRAQRKARDEAREKQKEAEMLAVIATAAARLTSAESQARLALEDDDEATRREMCRELSCELAEVQRRINLEASEEAEIAAAARRNREQRLREERDRYIRGEQEEWWRRRVVEVTRDLVWNETYERETLSASEAVAMARLDGYIRAQLDSPIIPLLQQESTCRSQIEDELHTLVRVLTFLELERRETTVRMEVQCAAGNELIHVVVHPFTVWRQQARFLDIELEQRRNIERESESSHCELNADHATQLEPLVARELWLTVVAEASARLKVEEAERECIATAFDGNSSSRQLVGKHALRVEEARREQAEYRERRIREIGEEELAQRILLQQSASEDRILIMEYFNRDGETAKQRAQHRKKMEIEQAIRAAQVLRMHQTEDVEYKQQHRKSAPKKQMPQTHRGKPAAAPPSASKRR